MKRKLIIAYVCAILLGVVAIWYGMSYAQETQPPAKEPTVTELKLQVLQERAAKLQSEYMYLQERSRTIQGEYAKVQAELKAMEQAEPKAKAPKGPEKKVDR